MDKKTTLRLAAAKAIDEFSFYVMAPTQDDYFWDSLDRYVPAEEYEEARREAFAICYSELDSIIETKFWKDWEDTDFTQSDEHLYVKMVNAIDAYLNPAITWRELRDAINDLPDECLNLEVIVDVTNDDARSVSGIDVSTLLPAISLA